MLSFRHIAYCFYLISFVSFSLLAIDLDYQSITLISTRLLLPCRIVRTQEPLCRDADDCDGCGIERISNCGDRPSIMTAEKFVDESRQCSAIMSKVVCSLSIGVARLSFSSTRSSMGKNRRTAESRQNCILHLGELLFSFVFETLCCPDCITHQKAGL